MSITTLFITAVAALAVCLAIALIRRFYVKNATAALAQSQAEKLLATANREIKRTRRVRAGTQKFTA